MGKITSCRRTSCALAFLQPRRTASVTLASTQSGRVCISCRRSAANLPGVSATLPAIRSTRRFVVTSGTILLKDSFVEGDKPMQRFRMRPWLLGIAALAAVFAQVSVSDAACCYFSAKNADILQPAQKAFLTWDPVEKVETFTVQPKFEGNALDFGMVIPTPSQPKLHEMPRDFFKHLAIYSIMKKREFAQSKLLPVT